MGSNPALSQEFKIPGNVGPMEPLPPPKRGKENSPWQCLPCMNGGGPVPLFGVRPSLWLASPCRRQSLYPRAKGSLGPQQRKYHPAVLGGQTQDRTQVSGMMHLLRQM